MELSLQIIMFSHPDEILSLLKTCRSFQQAICRSSSLKEIFEGYTSQKVMVLATRKWLPGVMLKESCGGYLVRLSEIGDAILVSRRQFTPKKGTDEIEKKLCKILQMICMYEKTEAVCSRLVKMRKDGAIWDDWGLFDNDTKINPRHLIPQLSLSWTLEETCGAICKLMESDCVKLIFVEDLNVCGIDPWKGPAYQQDNLDQILDFLTYKKIGSLKQHFGGCNYRYDSDEVRILALKAFSDSLPPECRTMACLSNAVYSVSGPRFYLELDEHGEYLAPLLPWKLNMRCGDYGYSDPKYDEGACECSICAGVCGGFSISRFANRVKIFVCELGSDDMTQRCEFLLCLVAQWDAPLQLLLLSCVCRTWHPADVKPLLNHLSISLKQAR